MKLREKSKSELEALLSKNREDLRKIRFGISKSKDVKIIGKIKKEIAKILTILKETNA